VVEELLTFKINQDSGKISKKFIHLPSNLYIRGKMTNFAARQEDKTRTMRKKEYMKPTVNVVVMQHRAVLLNGSPLNAIDSNLSEDDEFNISDDPAGEGFEGR
jgi:5-methylcytosine-specific restriction endonuclease McrBC GTP-binding regulatory subunit McrB